MTDRYENIRKALEGLRERCAQEAERITARRRAVAALSNDEAVKPCEVAAAIRKIDVQQHYECAVREIERLRAEVERVTCELMDATTRAERLAEALRESHGEVLRLRAAMFRVCATAANGGNPTMYIEQMRDEMDKPWSGDKASAALEQEAGR